MHARFACHLDYDQLLDLARLSVAEERPQLAFHEAVAAHTFCGAPRVDPVVIVLQDGDDVVGFLLARFRRMPFCDAEVAHQEALFVRLDKRSPEAEALLLNHFHEFATAAKAAEMHLLVSRNDAALRVFDHVTRIGYAPVGAQMKATAHKSSPVTAAMEAASVH